MHKLRIVEFAQRHIITADRRAWPHADHKRTYTLTATHLIPTKGARDE